MSANLSLTLCLKFPLKFAIIFDMETIYRLNTNELGSDFVNSLKVAYPDRNIKITVQEQPDNEGDETEYLMRSPANRRRLDEAIKNVEEGKVISFETAEEAIQCARERAAEL